MIMPSPPIPLGVLQSPNTTIHGNATALIPQSDINISYNQYGIAICRTNYVIDKTLALAQAPGRWAPHPWFGNFWNSLPEMQLQFDEVFCTIKCVYRGFNFGSTPETVYEFLDTATAQPIDTHPQFVSTLGGTRAAPLNSCVFNNDGRFAGFPPNAGNNLGGIKSWLAPSCIWRATYIYDSYLDVEDIGKVLDPEGPCPLLPSPQDWLYYSVTQRQQGNAYQVTKEWRASDPGAQWNPLIYNY